MGRTCLSGGYVQEYLPGHPLAAKTGIIWQHRRVYYDEHGPGPFQCHWCGATITWLDLHIDHLNDRKADNRPGNLVAACAWCNHARGTMLRFLGKIQSWRGLASLPDALDAALNRED